MNRALRADADALIRASIASVLPDEAVRRTLETYRPGNGKTLLVSVGKAAWQMARAAVDVLKRVDGGIVITKYGHVMGEIPFLKCLEAGHPVPDENSFEATKKALAMVSDLCAEDTVVLIKGIRILGLGGSIRYRPDAQNMYTEKEMASRIRALRTRLRFTGGFDILLTHSPIRGLGDQDNNTHKGFECFGPLLDQYRPAVMIHGHVHQAYSSHFIRQRDYHGIPVINASTSWTFDLPDLHPLRQPSRWGLHLMEKASRF